MGMRGIAAYRVSLLEQATMLSVGKQFAIAAILAMLLGFVRWPQPATGFWAITIKNRAYGYGFDYWAFSWGAVFAAFAAFYYWFPVVFSRSLSDRMAQLHFWLSAVAGQFGFLLLVPALSALTAPRAAGVSGTTVAVRSEAEMTASLVIMLISSLLFLVAAGDFCSDCLLGGRLENGPDTLIRRGVR